MTLETLFSRLHDPRVDRCKRHLLEDIVMIILCGTMAGAKHYHQIATYACHQQHMLKRFLKLSHGIPSQVTLWRVFERLDSRQLNDCIYQQEKAILEFLQEKNFPINHQIFKPTNKQVESSTHLLIIQSWYKQAGITVGQPKTAKKNNEKEVISVLLGKLALPGSCISIDAMRCRKSIARIIIEKQADYLLSLKQANGFFYEQVKDQLDRCLTSCKAYTEVESKEDGSQTRRCYTSSHLEWIEGAEHWEGLKSIVVVESLKEINATSQVKRNYYLCSMAHPPAHQILQLSQNHFEKRNTFHWVVDVLYDQDSIHRTDKEKITNLSLFGQFGAQTCLSAAERQPAYNYSNDYMKKILQKLVYL